MLIIEGALPVNRKFVTIPAVFWKVKEFLVNHSDILLVLAVSFIILSRNSVASEL